MRKIGISDLGDIAWGAHWCLLYETKADLFESVVPYFRAGLEANEFCLWAVSDPVTVEDARAALRRAIPDFDEHFAAGSIEIIPGREWYLKDDHFDRKRVTRGWYQKLDDALSRGYSGMRASGNAFWMNTKHAKICSEYEQSLGKDIVGTPPLNFLCTYAIPASGLADLLNVLKAHKFTIIKRNGTWELLEFAWTGQISAPAGSEEDAASELAGLSPREHEVLSQLAHGAKNKEIAARLGISERTVEVYRARILLKTKARNVQELVRLAILGGIDRQAKPPGKKAATKGR